MADDDDGVVADVLSPMQRYEQSVVQRIQDFDDPRQEWRRIFSEVLRGSGGGTSGSHAAQGDLFTETQQSTP